MGLIVPTLGPLIVSLGLGTSGGPPPPPPTLMGLFTINMFSINDIPINGRVETNVSSGLTIEVIDCKNLIATITGSYNYFDAINLSNWGLSLGNFVTKVTPLPLNQFALQTTRLLVDVVYTITVNA